VRDRMTVDSTDLTLKSIKTFACSFISEKFPEHGVTRYTNSPHSGRLAVLIFIIVCTHIDYRCIHSTCIFYSVVDPDPVD
jgi:hypothetical protein